MPNNGVGAESRVGEQVDAPVQMDAAVGCRTGLVGEVECVRGVGKAEADG
ncbi:hypothetical protein GCM10009564_50720 [Streptomyces thermogriseus]|uniref:Uncharacterized protein n=1 Tax=Streptomyces thermogriseus TaxID=75292 RepID=A0ABN1T639_9ACTN